MGKKQTAPSRLRPFIGFLAFCALLLLGPDGRQSRRGLQAQGSPCGPTINPIVCENTKPGNPASEWDISGMGDASIQGFATDISVDQGQTIVFKIKSTASDYRLDIYRLGYYGGAGARKVATVQPSALLPQTQPACMTNPATGLVDCGNWIVSASWAVPTDAVSGIYVAKAVRESGAAGASHIVFIVRDDDGQSDVLFQTSDTTWQAYNYYGGGSLYGGGVPSLGRATKVSYNRPFQTRAALPYPQAAPEDWLFNAEYPMVRWLEKQSYNVSYFTGVDSDRRGAEILEHKVFLSVGHDEYWSGQQRANVEAARNWTPNPLHLAFFSGNEVFWKIRWENSIDGSGTPYRTLVSYKETHADAKTDPLPNVWTGTWRDPRAFNPEGPNPENRLTGTIFTVNCCSYAIEVPEADGKMRFWRNTSISSLGAGQTETLTNNTLGYEWDEDLDNGARPPGLIRMSTTTQTVNQKLQDYGSTYAPGTATHSLTLYRHSSGALVFGAGTVQWPWGLDGNHDRGASIPNQDMQQATVNLLADMGVQPGTLQAPLVDATASTDTTRPVAAISTPANGASVQTGVAVTIAGSATDVGGVVGGVEVSTDNGATWHPAAGRASWSYNWVPGATGSTTIRARAADDSGNLQNPGAAVTVTVAQDTTPPTVPAVSPSNGAVGVAPSSNVTVTFNEPMNATTISPTTIELRDAANVLVPRAVTYDSLSNTALVDPTSPLPTSTTITLTVKGGAAGVKNAANLALASNFTSSFTTAATEPPAVGLVAAYGFNEGSGTSAADASGNGHIGTVTGASWSPAGQYGGALAFDGVNDWVTVNDAAALDLRTGMTLEAWVYPTLLSGWRTVLLKEQPGDLVYALYAHDNVPRPAAYIYIGGELSANGTAALPLNAWSHLAATYDGGTLRFYVNGALTSSLARTGPILVSSGLLRFGGNAVWGEYFQGRLDEIRIYNRALGQSEIQTDMATPVSAVPDTTPPTVAAVVPANGAAVSTATTVTATFSEAMDPATVTTTTFELRDAANGLVPATVSYDVPARRATLGPMAPLVHSTTYTATVKGGAVDPRVKDVAGNALAANFTWSFSTAAPPPPPPTQGPGGPILVIGSASNPFGTYFAEILRAEGLNEFAVADLSQVTVALLGSYDAVILGEMALTDAQVTMFSNWVTAGGNLIAMRPDKKLAGLLGLTDAGTTLSNAYLLVNTAQAPGIGIVNQTVQFHGAADRYTPSGATAIATLYSTATTATANPAVSIRSVGTNGGQAVAFTFDLARSVVYTRQGNPQWAGQNRDESEIIESTDLFFGAALGDPQPDWVNRNKIAIPQADEQQRLLANIILHVNADKKPLPRFWYFPRGLKAVVVMTGDDHGNGGTAGRFDTYKANSPPGCSVDEWECIRSSSYIYSNTPLTNAQAAAYVADGFEVALHVTTGSGCANWTPSSLPNFYANQLATFASTYPGVPSPMTNRTHCVAWSDYATQPQVELTHSIRLDTNYYYYPSPWVEDRPGLFTGSGMPMRFATSTGQMIDVYQATTQMTDESGQTYPFTVDTLFDRALGLEGYYGAFTVNMHTDNAQSSGSDAIVNSARSRGVPIVTARQMLGWLDGRNGSSFQSMVWSGNTLSFNIAVGIGANGLQAMVPTGFAGGALTAVERNGSTITHTVQTIKGIEYAVFSAWSGSYRAVYGGDTTAPVISAVASTPGTNSAAITWSTNEASTSRVDYGTSPASLTSNVSDPALVTAHSLTLSGLSPNTAYYYRVTSADALNNAATSPPSPNAPLSFTTLPPSISITDASVTEGNAGTTNTVFTVTLAPASSQTVTVNYATANGTATAGSDYVSISGTVTFTSGTTSRTITVAVNGDTVVEPNETFFVNLSNPTNATIARTQAVGTIFNDEPVPSMSIGDAAVTEGNAGAVSATFTVTLSASSSQIVTVAYATANGTAVAPGDYATAAGTLTFAPGVTSQTVSVSVIGDTLDEANETFVLNLSNPAGATLVDAQGVGTITDDDLSPSISIGDVTVTEGNSGTVNAVFNVTLSAASGQTITVAYATANGTATAGSDYVTASGTLTFAAGTTTQTSAVFVNGDLVDEPNETFVVNLSAPSNATLADAQGLGTILDDDPSSSGLVAAYGFEAGSGTTAADASGNGHTGTLSGATWTTAGRFGRALSFDGINDRVNISDAPALDIVRMTTSAWVRPTSLSNWRNVILKEVPGGLAYGLYANETGPRPTTWIRTGGVELATDGTSQLLLNTWTYLAATYDGSTLRLFVNGSEVASRAITGDIAVSNNPLRIGGNAIWGEYFAGQIDEVRIYNRALSQAEIQADMNVPVTP